MAIITWICLVTAARTRRGSPASQLINGHPARVGEFKGIESPADRPGPGLKKIASARNQEKISNRARNDNRGPVAETRFPQR